MSRRAQWTVPGLLAVVFLMPLIMAWASYHLSGLHREEGLQHGELMHPVRPLVPPGTVSPGSMLFLGRWTLLYRSTGVCDEPCRRLMDTLRRVRLAQGHSMTGVQRVLVLPLPLSTGDTDFARQDSSLTIVRTGPWDLPAGVVYLLDPQGNLVLRYPPGFDPMGLVKDLQRLLRLSGAG